MVEGACFECPATENTLQPSLNQETPTMTKFLRRALVATVAIGMLTGPSVAGAASNSPTGEDAELLATVAEATPGALTGAADIPVTQTSDDEAIEAVVGNAVVEVPSDPAQGITVAAEAGQEVTIGLPTASAADDAVAVQPGIVAYDNNNGSATVPVVKTDGSVAINTIITGPTAPTHYRYPVSVPDGAALALTDDGGAIVTNADGETVGTVDPAWAKDANGEAVSTRFEIAGTTLTQVVDHDSDDAYPVTADPWYNPFSWKWKKGIKFAVNGALGCVGAKDLSFRGGAWVIAKTGARVSGKVASRLVPGLGWAMCGVGIWAAVK